MKLVSLEPHFRDGANEVDFRANSFDPRTFRGNRHGGRPKNAGSARAEGFRMPSLGGATVVPGLSAGRASDSPEDSSERRQNQTTSLRTITYLTPESKEGLTSWMTSRAWLCMFVLVPKAKPRSCTLSVNYVHADSG